MPIENEANTHSFLPAYVQAIRNGVVRGLTGLTLEHPIELIRTKMQASPKDTSAVSVFKETFKNSGFRGFYAGLGPNSFTVVAKVAYRSPLIVWLPQFYKKNLFNNQDDYRILQKSLAGLTIAVIETLAVTPLEKFKVLLMTKKEADKTLKDLLFSSGNPLKASFHTWNLIFPRQIVSWTTFLTADEIFKSMARKHHNSEVLPYTTLFCIGIAVGTVNAAVMLPIEMAVTLVQKDNPWENHGLYKTIKSAHANFGIRGIYAGANMRMLQAIFAAILNVNLLYLNERALQKSTEETATIKNKLSLK